MLYIKSKKLLIKCWWNWHLIFRFRLSITNCQPIFPNFTHFRLKVLSHLQVLFHLFSHRFQFDLLLAYDLRLFLNNLKHQFGHIRGNSNNEWHSGYCWIGLLDCLTWIAIKFGGLDCDWQSKVRIGFWLSNQFCHFNPNTKFQNYFFKKLHWQTYFFNQKYVHIRKPGVNFTDILQAAFSSESVLYRFF